MCGVSMGMDGLCLCGVFQSRPQLPVLPLASLQYVHATLSHNAEGGGLAGRTPPSTRLPALPPALHLQVQKAMQQEGFEDEEEEEGRARALGGGADAPVKQEQKTKQEQQLGPRVWTTQSFLKEVRVFAGRKVSPRHCPAPLSAPPWREPAAVAYCAWRAWGEVERWAGCSPPTPPSSAPTSP